MWDNLLRVDWGRLTHAYGWATDAPEILRNMISPDKGKRESGWEGFWSALNHQGDFYDSTVAAIPFLVEAAANPKVTGRADLLRTLRVRWLDAPDYGGDPLAPEPPGGVDVPMPMLPADAPDFEPPKKRDRRGDDDFDIRSYRPMQLCAWQTGRAIQEGRLVFQKLLEDPDRDVAASAGSMLLLWPETRAEGKAAIIRTVDEETDHSEQARRILEFGEYAAESDIEILSKWVESDRPGPMRAAAAAVWACVVNPHALPDGALKALRETSEPDSDVFAKVPWAGVLPEGVWSLPSNADEVILRLADNRAKEIRWRAVQGLSTSFKPGRRLAAERIVPILVRRLADDYNRIRNAASLALADCGERALDVEPNLVSVLIGALESHRSGKWGDEHAGLDADASNHGHAARLLATISDRLTPKQRKDALRAIERAAQRVAGNPNEYVNFPSMGIQAASYLREQAKLLVTPRKWTLPELWAVYAFPDRQDRALSMAECDRRLAEAYATETTKMIAEAIQVVGDGGNRSAAIGAANWLMSIGPAAAPALDALDALAKPKDDPYVREQAAAAAAFVRESLLVTPLARYADRVTTADVLDQLKSPDAFVRAAGADLAAGSGDSEPVRLALERLLTDTEFADVGIVGRYECEGRLFHWRRERRSPRTSAIRALFTIGRFLPGSTMLDAMLEVAKHPAVVCGKSSAPTSFPIEHWKQAVAAAGGLAVADPRIRSARQECRAKPWAGNNAPYACATALGEVVRQLNGRLIPGG